MTNQNTNKTSTSTEDKNLLLSNRIGAVIMIGCLVITGALVLLLSAQTYSLNEHPQTIKAELVSVLEKEQSGKPLSNDSSLLLLEHDAQFLRTKRAQSLVSARLFIQSLSIMSGISLLIMGSAFVFARIKSPATTINVRTGARSLGEDGNSAVPLAANALPNSPGFYFSSHVPGLVLALLGTCIIIFTVDTSRKSTTETIDTPVFLPWPDGLVQASPIRIKEAENMRSVAVDTAVDAILEQNGIELGDKK